MPGFVQKTTGVMGSSLWVGDPDDLAAHQMILTKLRNAVNGHFLQGVSSLSNSVKGNLGEFVAYAIGNSYVFTNSEIAVTANAWDPLAAISRPDIDIIWLHFGSTEVGDWAALQEVKTTGQTSLQLADDLITDYDKLFGQNARVTLRTRLDALKFRLEQMGNDQLAPRLTGLGGPYPEECRGIRLVPTLIHDASQNSSTKMVAVRQSIIGRGWSGSVVDWWSVAIGDLDRRLVRLAQGQ